MPRDRVYARNSSVGSDGVAGLELNLAVAREECAERMVAGSHGLPCQLEAATHQVLVGFARARTHEATSRSTFGRITG